MNYITMLALAAPQAQQGGQQPNPILAFAPILLMFVIFYFLLIRPQQKKQKQHEGMLKNIKKGDKVVTTGGMIGVVVGVKENQIVLKVGEAETKLEFLRSAISQILSS
ncbi:MAG: preprotein translocase subunit YajC [Candidatus Omnitrophica bacterium]|nr:preprotein translocase subunit YajC [Candidatus Omnitrophota bacterium]